MEFECNIFQGFATLQFCNKVQELMTKMDDPSQLKRRTVFMSMFNDIIWGSEDNERECITNVTLVTLFAIKIPAGRWSVLWSGSEKKWFSTYIRDHMENGTESLNWWWSKSEKADPNKNGETRADRTRMLTDPKKHKNWLTRTSQSLWDKGQMSVAPSYVSRKIPHAHRVTASHQLDNESPKHALQAACALMNKSYPLLYQRTQD